MAAKTRAPHTGVKGSTEENRRKNVPSLRERRLDARTALAAEPAVRAAERAIVTESSTVLADTLAISASAEARRRLARVLDLKARAERDVNRREAYQHAADDLRSWAADVYQATLREQPTRPSRPIGTAASPRERRSVEPRPGLRTTAVEPADEHLHDPIARWEWEGGAVATDPISTAPLNEW